LLPRALFLRRLLEHGFVALLLLIASLAIGVLGYRITEGLAWIDALLNASMILGGMGPVNVMQSAAGKLFASAYALYSGMAFLATASILVAPLAHRLLHSLHLEEEATDD
jgi:hypothetical protein